MTGATRRGDWNRRRVGAPGSDVPKGEGRGGKRGRAEATSSSLETGCREGRDRAGASSSSLEASCRKGRVRAETSSGSLEADRRNGRNHARGASSSSRGASCRKGRDRAVASSNSLLASCRKGRDCVGTPRGSLEASGEDEHAPRLAGAGFVSAGREFKGPEIRLEG